MFKFQYTFEEFLRRNTGSGFTLIELLVVVAIIGIMSSITLSGFIGSKNSGQLAMDAQKIVTDVHRAQGYALALKAFKGNFASSTWGVHFTSNSGVYQIFSDVNNNGQYEASEKYQDITMESGTIVNGIYSQGTGANLSVTFRPPGPEIFIARNSTSTATATVRIRDPRGALKYIYFSKSGLVDIIPSSNIVGDIATNTAVILNSATGRSCSQLCGDFPRNLNWFCDDPTGPLDGVGLSPFYQGASDNGQYMGEDCLLHTANCSTVMATYDQYCSGNRARWVYCYCRRN